MPYKEVTKETKRKALELLIETKNNYEYVEKQTGVSIRTLKRWNTKRSNTLFKTANEGQISELLTARIKTMIEDEPDTNKSGWAMAIGIFIDKMLLLEGKPTSRRESLNKVVDEASDQEMDEMIAEAEAIIKARMRLNGNEQDSDESDNELGNLEGEDNGLSSIEPSAFDSLDTGDSNTTSDDIG